MRKALVIVAVIALIAIAGAFFQVQNPPAQRGLASITAPTGAINTVETIVVQTPPLGANRLVVGTTLRITLQGTCNSSVANASSFKIRLGTLGTTSDGLVATVNTPNAGTGGSAVAFEAILDLVVTAVGSGTNGTAVGTLQVFSVTTGIITTVAAHGQLTMSGFDTTVANQIISVSYISAAATTTSTFQQGYIEVVYN